MTAPRSLHGLRLLLVEDDPLSAKLLSLIITNAGAEVTTVGDALSALTVLQTLTPDLIVLDLVLPGMGGFAFAQQLKADPKTRDIVIVAVSVVNGAETQRAALDAGCAAYIRKPVDTETFAEVLTRHVKEPTP